MQRATRPRNRICRRLEDVLAYKNPEVVARFLAWHAFLMFTKDYADFCFRFFGEYIHHVPTSTHKRLRVTRRAQKDPEAFARARGRQMERQYRHIARHLGEETLRKWFLELAEKYPADKLRQLHMQALLAQSLPPGGDDSRTA